jgi:hypothetical protein
MVDQLSELGRSSGRIKPAIPQPQALHGQNQGGIVCLAKKAHLKETLGAGLLSSKQQEAVAQPQLAGSLNWTRAMQKSSEAQLDQSHAVRKQWILGCALAMVGGATTALIFCLIAGLGWQASLVLMGIGAVLTGGGLFTFLEVHRLAH